jgi:hypothetical protein
VSFFDVPFLIMQLIWEPFLLFLTCLFFFKDQWLSFRLDAY